MGRKGQKTEVAIQIGTVNWLLLRKQWLDWPFINSVKLLITNKKWRLNKLFAVLPVAGLAKK
jgi:hypothetical protein